MIANIRLQQFRSYHDATFEFSPGVNIIVGPNASGKTNLLEAVLVTAHGSSYRNKDSELVEFGAEWARLDALARLSATKAGLADEQERTVKLVGEPLPTKSYEFDGKQYKRLSLQQTLPVVLFEPNHLVLLSGSPERRREYLDEILEQTVPGYSTTLRNYRRTLAQRNALLKRPLAPKKEDLFVWNLRLSEFGAHIARHRLSLVEKISAQLSDRYRQLSAKSTTVGISYESKLPLDTYESALLKKLEADEQLDIARGFTGAGPHRDDFTALFDGRPAAHTASRGETRTFVLALKVIELELLEQLRGIQPILLLDDVFSELDGARRHALTDHLQRYQTFITTTDADIVSKHFTDRATIIPLGD